MTQVGKNGVCFHSNRYAIDTSVDDKAFVDANVEADAIRVSREPDQPRNTVKHFYLNIARRRCYYYTENANFTVFP